MSLTKKEILITYNELKTRFGHTKEFQKFEKQHHKNIEFIKFIQEHRLKYSKKTGWNKSFSPISKNIWISTPKKNWNKGLRKYGYYEYVQIGWELSTDFLEPKCQWCGKFLKNPKQTKFCDEKSHRKLFSKVVIAGKTRHGFDLKKNNHILIKPKLYDYEISKSGYISEFSLKERIEFKDIEFSVNGKRFPYTKKSGTIKPRQ